MSGGWWFDGSTWYRRGELGEVLQWPPKDEIQPAHLDDRWWYAWRRRTAFTEPILKSEYFRLFKRDIVTGAETTVPPVAGAK